MRADLSGRVAAGRSRRARSGNVCAVRAGSRRSEPRGDAPARRSRANPSRMRKRRRARRFPATIRARAPRSNARRARFGEIDVLVAAARFAKRYGCRAAEVERRCAACRSRKDAILPLAAELEREGRAFTPMDLALHDVAVLTGSEHGRQERLPAHVRIHRAVRGVRPSGSGRAARESGSSTRSRGWASGRTVRRRRIGGLLSSFAREVVAACATMLERAPRPSSCWSTSSRARRRRAKERRCSSPLLERVARARRRRLGRDASGRRRGGGRRPALRGARIARHAGTACAARACTRRLPRSRIRWIIRSTRSDPGTNVRGDAIALAALLGLDGSLIARRSRKSRKGPSRRRRRDSGVERGRTMDPLIITCAPVGAEIAPDATPLSSVHAREAGRNCATPCARRADRSSTCTAATTTERTRTRRAFPRSLRCDSRPERPHRAVLNRRRDRHDARRARERSATSSRDGDAHLRKRQFRRRDFREQLSDHARDSGEDARVRRAARTRDFRQGSLGQRAPLGKGRPARRSRSTRTSCSAFPAAWRRRWRICATSWTTCPRDAPGRWPGSAGQQLPMAMAAIAMGGHVRVGLEDNLYYSRRDAWRATKSSWPGSRGSPKRWGARSPRRIRRARSWDCRHFGRPFSN